MTAIAGGSIGSAWMEGRGMEGWGRDVPRRTHSDPQISHHADARDMIMDDQHLIIQLFDVRSVN